MTEQILTPVEEVLPEKFGIEQNQAVELMGSLPVVKQQREALIAEFNEVIQLDIELPETAKKAGALRKQIKENRTQGIDKWHKGAKEFFLRGGQFVDAIKRVEVAVNDAMEERLEQIEKYQIIKEQQRKEALRLCRVEKLQAFDSGEIPGLADMTDEQFNTYFSGVEAQYLKRIEEEKAEQERLRIQNLHNERYIRLAKYADFIPNFEELNFGSMSEELFIEFGTKAKSDKDAYDAEQSRIKAENERLQREKDEAEAKAKAEQKRIQDEANAKLKAEQDARAKAEAEALRKQKEAEAEAYKLKQAEEARKQAEAKAEADRLAEQEIIAQQGENQRLLTWIELFELPTLPGGKYGKKSNATVSDISAKFEAFKSWAKTQINL